VQINAATGAPQVQAAVPISFPIRLKKGDTVKAKYETATEVEKPAAPCAGSDLEPIASNGELCVYRGFAFKGGLEAQDQNASFFEFTDTHGESFSISGKVSPLGEIVVFRSPNNVDPFKEEAPVGEEAKVTHTSEQAYMSGAGAWAVTAN
jgi:hypothetical protein